MNSFALSDSMRESGDQSPVRSALSFERLIAPVTPDEFLDRYWSKSPLFVHRQDPAYFRSLYSLEDVDRSLLGAKLHPGQLLTIIASPNSGRETTRHQAAEVSEDKLYEAFSKGDSIRLMQLEEYWPPIAELAASLRGFFDAEVSVGFYMTPPQSQAFAIHFDPQENFIIQVDGSKEWFLYETEDFSPMDSRFIRGVQAKAPVVNEQTGRIRERVTLEKGDLLYVPRGFFHKAVTESGTSLHLTVSVIPKTWADFLKRTIELLCADHIELRKFLPPGYLRNPESRSGMPELFQSLLRLVADHGSFDETLRSLIELDAADRPYPPDGQFGALSRIPDLEPASWVEKRPGLACLVERRGDSAVIRFGKRRVQGPLSIAPALEFVRDHGAFRIDQLPGGLGDKSKLVLVGRLVREGLLRVP